MSRNFSKIVLARAFNGMPKLSDFQIKTELLPAVKEGEIVTEAQWISVDPYIRAYVHKHRVGATIFGGQVAKVIESRHDDYKVGDLVVGDFGWRTHNVVDPDKTFDTPTPTVYKFSNFGDHSPSLGLGVLGMPGITAHFAFLERCQPKAGEVVVITGAAGAVGSHVAQLAKHQGCIVIGFAGSDEKVDYLLKELKIDAAFNYKTANLGTCMSEIAPKGVDIYFDNVGGEISSTIMYQMKEDGRIVVCGSISSYNIESGALPKATILQPAIVMKRLLVQGFHVTAYGDHYQEGIQANLKAINEGWLKCPEKITHGFEKLPEAFIDMLQGGNVGKAVVKI